MPSTCTSRAATTPAGFSTPTATPGHEVERTLTPCRRARGARTQVLTGTRLVDVLTDAGDQACGVRVLRRSVAHGRGLAPAPWCWPPAGSVSCGRSRATLQGSTGDGVAAALRAGAVIRDAEFMQFHPTILVVPPAHRIPGDRGVLISEAVRGEGAFLIDSAGRRIMAGVHPLADLAPRDVVSAAIMAHLAATGGDASCCSTPPVFGAERWEGHFPGILAMCRERGVDPVTRAHPGAPGRALRLRRVWRRTCSGITRVPGLYAVGEVAGDRRPGSQPAGVQFADRSPGDGRACGSRTRGRSSRSRPLRLDRLRCRPSAAGIARCRGDRRHPGGHG